MDSTSGDGWQDGHEVARLQPGVESCELTNMIFVHEHVDVRARFAALVAEVAVDLRVQTPQLFEKSANVARRDPELRPSRAKRAQDRRDANRDIADYCFHRVLSRAPRAYTRRFHGFSTLLVVFSSGSDRSRRFAGEAGEAL